MRNPFGKKRPAASDYYCLTCVKSRKGVKECIVHRHFWYKGKGCDGLNGAWLAGDLLKNEGYEIFLTDGTCQCPEIPTSITSFAAPWDNIVFWRHK